MKGEGLLNRKSGQLAIMFVSMVLGIMLAAQFKNVQRVGGSTSIQRAEELTARVQKLTQENEDLQEQIRQFQQRIREYEQSAQNTGQLAQTVENELQQTRMLAGLTDVEGPGLIITVDENIPMAIQYDNLLTIVNELNAAGAEAIAINEERIIATTEIRNAGNHININTTPYSPPYVFKVIGDAENLEKALTLRGGVVDMLSTYNITVRIQKTDKVTVPKYAGAIKFKYAKPVPPKE